jgi:hypothetical protein
VAEQVMIVKVIGDDTSLQRMVARDQKAIAALGTTTTSNLGKVDSAFTKTQRIAAGGFIGGAALTATITGIRSVVGAAAESQQVLGQTQVALEATGNSWAQYRDQIEDTVAAQSRLGFDDEALLRTFSLFARTTGDVGKALRLNNLAMDVARARFIDVEQAALLVNKAVLGQAGALRRLGINVDNTATSQQLLTALTQKYGGSAQAASEDAATAFDRAAVATENLKEAIGGLASGPLGELASAFATNVQGVADLIEGLQKLAKIKIPPIRIPIVPDTPGGTVGGIFDKAFDILKFSGPAAPFTIPAEVINQIKARFGDGTEDATSELASSFERDINTMLESALNDALSGARPKAPSASAVRGFGRGLVPSDLYGPLVKGISDAQREALLDARRLTPTDLSDDLAELLDVKADLTRALDDPRLKRKGRIEIKEELDSVQSQIDSVNSQIEQAVREGNQKRADALERAARAAEKARDDQRAKLERIREARRDAAERAAEALQERQFRAVGLGPTGAEIVPGVENLRKQLAALSKNVVGEDVPKKLLNRLAGVRKVLAGGFGKVTEETRSAIKELFDTIRDTFDEETRKGPLTKTSGLNSNKILQGLGLDRNVEKELRARLSSFNSAGRSLSATTRPNGMFVVPGRQPVVVESHTTINMDNDVVARSVTRSQQRTRRRNPAQKRGPNTGV